MRRVQNEKIEALALDLGYQSPKNFFHAFKNVTGVTPAAFRDLPRDEARRITEVVQLTLGTPRIPRPTRPHC
jgi:AraC-like DNA-binding protein